jgi:4-amino-4-deoxy-L-arabinose transferase-like glycosyltransferase
MFYNLEKWGNFGWDQIDNAWAAVRIILTHKYPLLGMVAKGNSGIYIGPLYYYLVAVFYFFTGLNPIASPILAGVTSLFSFWVIYCVAKEIFNKNIAVVSCFIYTFSSSIILSERVQWPVNFIAPLSLLIFYFLYRVICGESKYLIHLAIVTGLSFHIHFTSIFYPMYILLALPFFTWDRKIWKYIAVALIVGLLFLIPQIIYYLSANHSGQLTNYSGYIGTNYHGFHLRRMLQLSHDAFIKFQFILESAYPMLRNAVFFYIPVFFLATRTRKPIKNTLKLWYLTALLVLVPWIIFSTYSGEISDYYFNGELYLAVIILGYLTVWIWKSRHLLLRISVVAFWTYYAWSNVGQLTKVNNSDFLKNSETAQKAVLEKRRIEFVEGDPKSYLYYYNMYRTKQPLPYNM